MDQFTPSASRPQIACPLYTRLFLDFDLIFAVKWLGCKGLDDRNGLHYVATKYA
jgi:hypothetical protein